MPRRRRITDEIEDAISIELDELTGWLLIKSTYDKGFLYDLQNNTAPARRQWVREAKVWLVAPEYLAEVLAAARKHYADVRCKVDLSIVVSPFEQFIRMLPPDTLHKAYRDAAKVLHPDAGGTTKEFQDLGEAWTKIKKALGL